MTTTPQADEELEKVIWECLGCNKDNNHSLCTSKFNIAVALIKARDEQREREIREKSHREGYSRGVYDFENYFMDASIPAQRHPIGKYIAQELVRDYKYPYQVKIPSFTDLTQSSKGETQ